MTEEKTPDLETRLALDIFFRLKASQYPQCPMLPYRDEDMEPNNNGPFYRREDGTIGDWYYEIFEPAHPPRFTTGRTTEVRWNENRQFATPIPEEAPPETEPVMRQVQRLRVTTSQNELMMRYCKAEAKEILAAICKD